MRDLQADMKWLHECQRARDLSDEYLRANKQPTREGYNDYAPDLEYGITFVESTIARQWLQRAIEAEEKLRLIGINERAKHDNQKFYPNAHR